MRRLVSNLLAAALVIAPFGAQAADLVVWWEKGFNPEEDAAVREIIAAFEQKTGKQVDLAFYEQADFPDAVETALEAGQPPDFAFGTGYTQYYISKWAFDDRLADLTDTVGHFSDLFDPDALAWYTLLNQKSGHRARRHLGYMTSQAPDGGGMLQAFSIEY